jgi:hypothetical protein
MAVGEITADDITASAANCRLQQRAWPAGGIVVGPAQQREE